MRLELTQPTGHYPLKVARLPIPPPGHLIDRIGAKNGTRTRDPDLGKVVLYQLSYFRISNFLSASGSSRVSLFALQSYDVFFIRANISLKKFAPATPIYLQLSII